MAYRNMEKQRAFQREWMRQRRAEYMKGKVCEKCASTKKLIMKAHKNAPKIQRGWWAWRIEKRQEVIARTSVLCWKCAYPGRGPRKKRDQRKPPPKEFPADYIGTALKELYRQRGSYGHLR